MKRFHVHVAVANLAESIRFYSDLFGLKPTVERPDYAKWMLTDPCVNFAISSRGHYGELVDLRPCGVEPLKMGEPLCASVNSRPST